MPFISAAGHTLEYQRIDADPSKPVLVFLHEGLGSITQWRDFPQKVSAATGCPALVYARYGYGQSDVLKEPRPLDFMHREAQVALPELLAALGIVNPILIGHSDGATISLIYAGSGHPLRGMVVEAPHVLIEQHNMNGIRTARQTFESTDLPKKLARHHRDPAKTFYGWHDAWMSPEFQSWNVENILPGIHCPLMAIQGEDDAYGTMAQLDAIARQVSGPCELVKLADCGHTPHKEQPEKTFEAVTRFVGDLLSAERAA
jgi:pimeloyl-ACP methyl ester carboxylesterase